MEEKMEETIDLREYFGIIKKSNKKQINGGKNGRNN